MLITNLNNPKIKAVVQLHQRKHREATQTLLIEGLHPIEEALAAGICVTQLFVREGVSFPAVSGAQTYAVSEAVMAKLSTTESPPPILAVGTKPDNPSHQVVSGLVLGLMGVQDPGNMGTLVRTACAFGVDTVVTVGSQVDPYHPKVIRASAGLVFRLTIVSLSDIEALKTWLGKLPDLTVWGADAHRGESYRETSYLGNQVLLLGSEAHGIPVEAWEIAKPLHIPMHPRVESLNVALAGAIILAEAFQQRRLSAGVS